MSSTRRDRRGSPREFSFRMAAIAGHCRNVQSTYELDSRDVVLQFASLSFDVSLEEILPTLIVGARLVVMGTNVWHPAEFHRKIAEFGLTVLNLPTAYWQELAREWADVPDAGSEHSAQTLHCRRRYDVARCSQALAANPGEFNPAPQCLRPDRDDDHGNGLRNRVAVLVRTRRISACPSVAPSLAERSTFWTSTAIPFRSAFTVICISAERAWPEGI